MTKFNSDTLNSLRKDLVSLFEKYGIENSLEFDIGKMKYSDSTVKFEVSAFIKDAGIDGRKNSYISLCAKFGASPSWYGKDFFIGSSNLVWKVVAINSRARTFPIIIENEHGVQAKYTVEGMRAIFENRKLSELN